MRLRSKIVALLMCAGVARLFLGVAEAQAPAASQGAAQPAAQKAASEAAPTPVYANLAQLMRGIIFPNSNVIYFAQTKNPDNVKRAPDPSVSPDPLSGSFGGWAAIENSALALSESASLLTIPGRVCQNGLPVPVNNADWSKFVQELRDAGMTAYKAAQTKNNDKMIEAADVVTDACSNCHDRYRDRRGGVAGRCK
jgi:hypothetical protein